MKNGFHQHTCETCGKSYDCPLITHCHAGENYPARCNECLEKELPAASLGIGEPK